MHCINCGSQKLNKNGMGHDHTQHYKCKDCGKDFTPFGDAKILIFDIENTPATAYAWTQGIWETNVRPEHLIKDWNMLSFSAKWLDDSKVISDVLTPKEALGGDDKRLTKHLWDLLDEADFVIGHNLINFDIPMSNTRFLKHGFGPPSPLRAIDTLKIAKKVFSVTFNSLNYLSDFLKIGRKEETGGFDTWKQCMNGDAKALKIMSKYNAHDVTLTEDVYHALRPWMPSHPNVNVFKHETGCARCGSTILKARGRYTTNTGIYTSYQCQDCGGHTRISKRTGAKPTKTPARFIATSR